MVRRICHSTRAWVRPLGVAVAMLAAESGALGQFAIRGVAPRPDGSLEIQFPADASSYYRLLRGVSLVSISTPVRLTLAPPVLAPPESGAAQFYRVEQIARSGSLDTDGDGIPDVYELEQALDGLDPADALRDPDGDGRTALQEYQDSVAGDRLITVQDSSPQVGEAGVSVNRELIVEFSAPLAEGTVLGPDQLFAGFSGRRFLGRVELSSDRRRATLFHLEPLPGGTRVVAVLDATGIRDAQGREVDADGDGRPGGVTLIPFDTHSNRALANTAVVGQVFASELGTNSLGQPINQPLAGVTITVDGAEETVRAVTDVEGRFTLSPAPSGRFFVHVDGRTAVGSQWPQGVYYPFIGKAWEAEPGRTNNLAGGTGLIYLPRISAGALQTVSATTDTRIAMDPETLAQHPELAGVELVVPANALFADNGTRGGRVGMAPVPPDRLPEPLPPGLNLPLVITVQTDGPSNFERPAPVRFPNLPNPVTGVPLPPGSKSALWSFSHDTGRWEIVGPMTVSADGKFVDTDAGVGIRQPGWHGTQPGVGASGGPLAGSGDCGGSGAGGGGGGGGGPRPRPGFDPASTVNGCGPASFPPFLMGRFDHPFIAPEANFKPACDQHDIGYSTCGKSKEQTDTEFLADMEAACFAAYAPGSNELAACLAAAAAYYTAVSSTDTGQDAYNSGQREGCEDPPTDDGCGGGSGESEPESGPVTMSDHEVVRLRVRHAVRRSNVVPGEYSSPVPAGTLVPQLGPHRFAVFDSEGRLVQRGRAGSGGVAFDSLILAPETRYVILLIQEATGREGWLDLTTGPAGSRLVLPTVYLSGPLSFDADGDGLSDVGELVVGTREDLPDTDGDGMTDGMEVRQGTNPLGEQPEVTGLLASAAVDGVALDVDALDGLAVVAAGPNGVAVFSLGTGFTPTLRVQADTPGDATRVALGQSRIMVADGAAGVTVVSLESLAAPLAQFTVPFAGDPVTAVTALGTLGVAGTERGALILMDLISGAVVQRLEVGEAVQDLTVTGDAVVAVTGDRSSFGRRVLRLFRLDGAWMEPAGTVTLSGFGPEGLTRSSRVFAADGLAYVTAFPGFDVVSIADLASPQLVVPARDAGPNSFKQIVLNGTGLGLAAVGNNPRADGTHDLSVYDTRVPADGVVFRTTLPTPGLARALTLYNGLAYVADGEAGLQVLSYLPFDLIGQAPTVRLEASFPLDRDQNTGRVETGKLARLTAAVGDDVQVRQVEFFVGGVRVATDGNYPFEIRFVTPLLTETRRTFTVQVRVTDTGGNVAASAEFVVELVPDATAPRVVRTAPEANAIPSDVRSVVATFNEPIAARTLSEQSFRVTGAGPDAVLGTLDDTVPQGGWFLRGDGVVAALDFAEPLPAGLYEMQLSPPLSDVAGNPLAGTVTVRFVVFGPNPSPAEDADGDGLSDVIERILGLDPANAGDAERDLDGDGLGTLLELRLGLNPLRADTDGNGVPDGAEDLDRDGLSNAVEQFRGTDPLRADTDGDGWPDEGEVTGGSDPRDPQSRPFLPVLSQPPVEVLAPGMTPASGLAFGSTLANPPVELMLPAAVFGESSAFGSTLARPPVEILAPSFSGSELGSGMGPTLAGPPVELILPAAVFGEASAFGSTLARPPIEVLLPGTGLVGEARLGPTQADPPVTLFVSPQ